MPNGGIYFLTGFLNRTRGREEAEKRLQGAKPISYAESILLNTISEFSGLNTLG